jgi:hypothetical protein
MSLIEHCHEIFKPITKGIIDVEWGVMEDDGQQEVVL